MKASEVTAEVVKSWGRIEEDDDDTDIERLIIPAAIDGICSYTGLTLQELDKHEEIGLALVALCVFLYDNRTMNILNDKDNKVISSFLDSHRVNLL